MSEETKTTPAAEVPPVEKNAGTADTKTTPETPPTTETKVGPPETYVLTVPPGSEQWLDVTDVKSLESHARDKGWTNEQAQAAVTETIALRAAESAAFRTMVEADPIYGGGNLAETDRLANLALDKVRPKGTPAGDAVRGLLARTGYGNHPQVVGMLAEIGKLMAEDRPAPGAGGGATPRDAATVLYGSGTK